MRIPETVNSTYGIIIDNSSEQLRVDSFLTVFEIIYIRPSWPDGQIEWSRWKVQSDVFYYIFKCV